MNYSSNGLALTKKFEGCVLHAYQDVIGTWTIGFGHTAGVKAGDTCTEAQASQWLEEDIQGAVEAVERLVTTALNQNQFDALVDFVYNLGSGALRYSTLLKLLNSGDYAGAAEQFPAWSHAGGKLVPGLLARREAEQQLFSTNV